MARRAPRGSWPCTASSRPATDSGSRAGGPASSCAVRRSITVWRAIAVWRVGHARGGSAVSRVVLGRRSSTALAYEQPERIAPGGMLAKALDQRGGPGGHPLGLRQRHPVYRRHDDRGGQRRESQVGGAEAIAAEVLAALGQELCHEVELAPDRGLVLGLDAPPDAELPPR